MEARSRLFAGGLSTYPSTDIVDKLWTVRQTSTTCGKQDQPVDNFFIQTILMITEKIGLFKGFSGRKRTGVLQFIHRSPAEIYGIIHNILWFVYTSKHKQLWSAGDFRHFLCQVASDFVWGNSFLRINVNIVCHFSESFDRKSLRKYNKRYDFLTKWERRRAA